MVHTGLQTNVVRWTLWSVYRSLLCGMLVGMALCEMPSLALVAGTTCAAMVPAFVANIDIRRGKCPEEDQRGNFIFMTYFEMMLILLGAMATIAWLPYDLLISMIALSIGVSPVAFSWRAHTLVSRSVFGIGARLDARFSKTVPVTPYWANVLRVVDNRGFVMLMIATVTVIVTQLLSAVIVTPLAISFTVGMMMTWVVSFGALSAIGREVTINWNKAGREMHTMPAWLD